MRGQENLVVRRLYLEGKRSGQVNMAGVPQLFGLSSPMSVMCSHGLSSVANGQSFTKPGLGFEVIKMRWSMATSYIYIKRERNIYSLNQ